MEWLGALGRRCREAAFWGAAFFLVFFGALLAFSALESRAGAQVYRKAALRYAPRSPDSPVDFAALEQVNPDIVGWVEIPALDLSYPLVQGQDNQYYLSHRYDRSPGAQGALFLDAAAHPGLEDPLTIVYGHNMGDGSMLGRLDRYRQQDLYTQPVLVYLPAQARPRRYQPLLLAQAPADAPFYFARYALGSREYAAFLDWASGAALCAGELAPDPACPTLLLSTCTWDGRARLVLLCREAP